MAIGLDIGLRKHVNIDTDDIMLSITHTQKLPPKYHVYVLLMKVYIYICRCAFILCIIFMTTPH